MMLILIKICFFIYSLENSIVIAITRPKTKDNVVKKLKIDEDREFLKRLKIEVNSNNEVNVKRVLGSDDKKTNHLTDPWTRARQDAEKRYNNLKKFKHNVHKHLQRKGIRAGRRQEPGSSVIQYVTPQNTYSGYTSKLWNTFSKIKYSSIRKFIR